MIKNNRNNEQIYGRNDMIMLDPNNKIYGSLGLADNYVMKTEEGTRLTLRNPKLDSFANVLTEFNMYGRSEQKQYKGINLFPPNTGRLDFVEVSIPKGSPVFWVTDGTPAMGGNFRFFNEDKTEDMWFGVDAGATSTIKSLTIDAKYVQNLLTVDSDLSKMCLGVGDKPIYEPYVGGKPSPSPDYPQEIKSVVNPIVKVTNEDGTQFETATLTYTLNAIPVASGGNVTIDGQQWVCDEVDLERGVKVQRVGKVEMPDTVYGKFSSMNPWDTRGLDKVQPFRLGKIRTLSKSMIICTALPGIVKGEAWGKTYECIGYVGKDNSNIDFYIANERLGTTAETTVDDANKALMKWLETNPFSFIYALTTPIETPLTPVEIAAFNAFTTYYPVTIIENNYSTWMKATYKSTESV